LLEQNGLLRGKAVAIDATTLEANAAMKSIVRKVTLTSQANAGATFMVKLARQDSRLDELPRCRVAQSVTLLYRGLEIRRQRDCVSARSCFAVQGVARRRENGPCYGVQIALDMKANQE